MQNTNYKRHESNKKTNKKESVLWWLFLRGVRRTLLQISSEFRYKPLKKPKHNLIQR
jgi:hypothetical protein